MGESTPGRTAQVVLQTAHDAPGGIGSGIGRAFAEAFHAAGNQVVVAGRRQQMLDGVTAARMAALVLDVADREAVGAFAQRLVADYRR